VADDIVGSIFKGLLVLVEMPPKSKAKPGKAVKRPGEKKRGGKSQIPAHDCVNEQTKESYLVEIKELDSRLTR
jgi:hypothetical protein